ncbi:MAG: hypothetical protein AAFW66_15310, partial [Pseudomonadota bacterium]
ADPDFEKDSIQEQMLNLKQALNEVRSAQADREDVVVDMKHATLSRLELLAADLQPVIEEIPKDNEQFEFAIAKGETPRFWIDMTSFVRMGGDGREYQFVKDTRMGRVVLEQSTNRKLVGERVTQYVAERVLERERMIEGDWESVENLLAAKNASGSGSGNLELLQRSAIASTKPKHSTMSLFVWLMIGLGIGGLGILALAWFGQIREMVLWITNSG